MPGPALGAALTCPEQKHGLASSGVVSAARVGGPTAFSGFGDPHILDSSRTGRHRF